MTAPVALALFGTSVGFTLPQIAILLAAWAVLFLWPALRVRADARRRGIDPRPWFLLVLIGSFIGVLQYRTDQRVRARKTARGEAVEPAVPPELRGR